MKILKKKRIVTLEFYLVFLGCIYAGLITYKYFLDLLFDLN